MSTETALREWRNGPVQAERLAASILRLENYQNVEPRAPLGGGDGGADIFCDRGGRRWVGAVYFPPTEKAFYEIKKKFGDDLDGALRHRRHGIIFVTNQRLTLDQRQTFVDLALAKKQECITYDVERIRGVLDSPQGYGLRVGYLRIPMSPEEQIAYFASRENVLEAALAKNMEHLELLARHMNNLQQAQKHVVQTMSLVASAQGIDVEPLRASDPLAIGQISADAFNASVTANLSPEMILFTHRLVCFDAPPRMIGRYRQDQIYLRRVGADRGEPTHSPPPATEVPKLVVGLCEDWKRRQVDLTSEDKKLEAIAYFFHRLLVIHPFSDGNGRAARTLLMQQCIELFGRVDMSLFDRGVPYYEALEAADAGNLEPLKKLIARTIGG